jgi:hypothetical protein
MFTPRFSGSKVLKFFKQVTDCSHKGIIFPIYGSAHKLLHILFAKCPVFMGLLRTDYAKLFFNDPYVKLFMNDPYVNTK